MYVYVDMLVLLLCWKILLCLLPQLALTASPSAVQSSYLYHSAEHAKTCNFRYRAVCDLTCLMTWKQFHSQGAAAASSLTSPNPSSLTLS